MPGYLYRDGIVKPINISSLLSYALFQPFEVHPDHRLIRLRSDDVLACSHPICRQEIGATWRNSTYGMKPRPECTCRSRCHSARELLSEG